MIGAQAIFQCAGAVLMAISVAMLVRGKEDGDHTVVILGQQMKTNSASLVLLFIGAGLFVFPFTAAFHDNFHPMQSKEGKTDQGDDGLNVAATTDVAASNATDSAVFNTAQPSTDWTPYVRNAADEAATHASALEPMHTDSEPDPDIVLTNKTLAQQEAEADEKKRKPRINQRWLDCMLTHNSERRCLNVR